MRISINWLKELVEYDMPTGELAMRLNNAGLELAEMHVYGSPKVAEGLDLPENHLTWDNIVLGEILEVKKHPDADRLRLAIVDCGDGPKQSVTGAPNIEIGSSGQKVAVAVQGARIYNAYSDAPDPDPVKVRPAKLRGEKSEIVLCSEKELQISDEHEGIMLIESDAPIGTPISDILGDVVLEVEITPNIARCLNMVGVAREVAALANGKLIVEEPQWQDDGDPVADQFKVDIEDPEMCARFTGAVIRGIEIKPSPFWLQYRLTLAGQRPISNIVDITNYVMLEWGQPLHAYDYHTVKPKEGEDVPYILVRNARQGETLVTLDGQERKLDEDIILITDGGGPIGLGGIMGGLDTEVTDDTKDILLEAANFNFISNRRTAQKLKLFSEASNRFSKGLPPELDEYGLKRAAELMRQLAGGTIAKGFVDNFPNKPEPTVITLPGGEATRLLGVELSVQEVADLLTPLGFECETQDDAVKVTVPYYRIDVTLPADLVEEVARMLDYDKLPTRLLKDALPPQQANPALQGKLRVKRVLTQLGLQEVINYTLTNPRTVEKSNPQGRKVNVDAFVQLENTLSSERSILRQTMLPNLLETAESNWRFQDRISMFEIGRVFLPQPDEVLPHEPTHIGIILMGDRDELSWIQDEGKLDFFDLKGVVDGLMSGLNIHDADFKPTQHEMFHPGRCAELRLVDDAIGVFGELHPRVAEAFDLEGRVCAAEFNLDVLLAHIPEIPEYTPPPRYPSVVQDIALVVETSIPSDEIEELILDLGQPLLQTTKLFDVYTGEHVPEGKRSLAYSLTYQASDRTLTDEEVTEVHEQIQKGLQEKLSAEIRGLS